MTAWTVLDYRDLSNSNWSARGSREGPELDLVMDFVDYLRTSRLNRDRQGLILLEPLVGHRYPDILVIEYYDSRLRWWHNLPCTLGNDDFRILHHMEGVGRAEVKAVSTSLGFGRRECERSLERLAECELIWERGRQWNAYRSRHIYPIASITGVEAKVGRWSDVSEQATFHLWYSNQSLIVNPRREIPNRVSLRVAALGIGVKVPDGAGGWEVLVEPETREGPPSFMSWRIAWLVADLALSCEAA